MPSTKQRDQMPNNRLRRAFAAYISNFTCVCVVIAFCTPYWLQSWTRVHTPIDRLGLWEFCLDGFTMRRDPRQITYFQCWWIFAPYVKSIRSFLTPPWFVAIQCLFTVGFILQLLLNIWILCYQFRSITNLERRVMSSRAFLISQIICALIFSVSIIIFGVRWEDPYWIPYPHLNWPSWSYGFACLSAFGCVGAAITYYFVAREDRRILDEAQEEFPLRAMDALTAANAHPPTAAKPYPQQQYLPYSQQQQYGGSVMGGSAVGYAIVPSATTQTML